jgi:hypothetical protein
VDEYTLFGGIPWVNITTSHPIERYRLWYGGGADFNFSAEVGGQIIQDRAESAKLYINPFFQK